MNQATQDFIRQHQDDDVRQLAFLGSKNPEVNMPFALDQIRGRQMARIKLPRWASIDGIIYPPHISMEQCSSEQTALYKAELAARLLGNSSLSSLRGEIVPQGDNSKICEFAAKSTVDSEFAQNEGTCASTLYNNLIRRIMERTEENNATKDRFAHVGKIFSEMDSEKLQAEIAERSKIIKRKIDALMELHMSGI